MVMDAQEFTSGAEEVINFLCDYKEDIESISPIVPSSYHNTNISALSLHFPEEGESFHRIFKDFKNMIFPSIVHLSSPRNYTIFPSPMSLPSVLGDVLAAAMGGVGFSWKSCPALTEMEAIVCDWYARLLGLPPCFMYDKTNQVGGGCFQQTNNNSMYNCILAARHIKMQADLKMYNDKYRNVDRFVVYASKDCLIDLPKLCATEGLIMRLIITDTDGAMDIKKLQAAVTNDKKNGLVPMLLVATLGSVAKFGCDDVEALGPIARANSMWLHVDGTYGGNALILGRYADMAKGLEQADSIAANPTNWLNVAYDCVPLWLKNTQRYQEVFLITPVYLRNDHKTNNLDFRHFGIALSRRFRALKVWLTFRIYGTDKLKEILRRAITLREFFAEELEKSGYFNVVQSVFTFGNFTLKNCEPQKTEHLYLNVIKSLQLDLFSPFQLDDKFTIRFSILHEQVTKETIRNTIKMLVHGAKQYACVDPNAEGSVQSIYLDAYSS